MSTFTKERDIRLLQKEHTSVQSVSNEGRDHGVGARQFDRAYMNKKSSGKDALYNLLNPVRAPESKIHRATVINKLERIAVIANGAAAPYYDSTLVLKSLTLQ